MIRRNYTMIGSQAGRIFIALLILLTGCDQPLPEGTLISEEQIMGEGINRFLPHFKPLASGKNDSLYLTKLAGLYRLDQHSEPILLHQFDSTLQGVIELRSGTLIVSTDNHHQDMTSPNILWRSDDGGNSFIEVLRTTGGTIFHWSLAQSKAGSTFAAEYGPQKKGMSKTLWRSDDDGRHWRAVFIAEDRDGIHLHRITTDPYTGHLWLTQGDDEYAQLYRSTDNGDNWQPIANSQAVGIVFTEEYLYLGEDTDRTGRIGRLHKATLNYEPQWFSAKDIGNYSGSVYTLTKMKDTPTLILANMKYEYEDHIAALIKVPMDNPSAATPILHLNSIAGSGQGLDIAIGPTSKGVIYWPGWRLLHH